MTIAGWFLASRVVIAALGVVGVASFATLGPDGRAGTVLDTTAALNPINVWHKWDAIWYEQIAEHGYAYQVGTPRGDAAAGFFPLYPMTVRLVRTVAPSIHFFWIGSLLSNLFALAALFLLARELVTDDELSRVLAVLLMSAGSFYLSIPYSESLFLLLVVATIAATRKGRFELAGLLAGAAATTRAHGLALLAVPALGCWLDARQSGGQRLRRTALTLALFAIPVLAYLALLARDQGSWHALFSRQELWDNPSPYPLRAFTGFFEFPRRISNWLHGAFWLMYAGLLLRYWRSIPIGEAVFCAGVFLISTQQEAFHGTYRYVVPLVPLALAIARDRPKVRHWIIAVNLLFGVLMLLAFVTHNRLTV
jgi:Gpi18-like mannosyltransferase